VRIAEPLFPNDDGSADPQLIAAMSGGDRYEIVRALAKARVFIALLAKLESPAIQTPGAKMEQESEVSLAWLVDGSVKALPIFTSIAALNAWSVVARPLGVEAQRAAVVALADGEIAVMDPGGKHPIEIGPSALRSLALGYEYVPISVDPEVRRAIEEALDGSLDDGQKIDFSVFGDFPEDLVITLADPIPALDHAQLSALARHLAEDARIRLRLEAGLQVKIATR
jgi:hypothetical protein